jgi:hypothetical protein
VRFVVAWWLSAFRAIFPGHAAAAGVVPAVPEVLMRVVLPVRGVAGLV